MAKSILLGRILSAHGLKGEVKVKSFTGEPLALGDYGPLSVPDGRVFEIVSLRPQGELVIATLKGVQDRALAEQLQGLDLSVARAKLPKLTGGDFYQSDLIGLEVCAADGGKAGLVIAVQNFGAGDLIEVKRSAPAKDGYVPFTRLCVPEVLIAEGRLVLSELGLAILDGLEAPQAGFARRARTARPALPRARKPARTEGAPR